MRTRPWSIRAKIISLLLVPLIALIGMWAYSTAIAFAPAIELDNAQTNFRTVILPIETVVAELQRERRVTMAYLGTPHPNAESVSRQRGRTDAAIAELRRITATDEARDAANSAIRDRIASLDSTLASLVQLRGSIDRSEVNRTAAHRDYTAIIRSAFLSYDSVIGSASDDVTRQARSLLAFARAAELLAQVDAVLTGALAAGKLSGEDRALAVQLIGAQRFVVAESLSGLVPPDRAAYERLAAGDAFARLTALQDTLLTDARAGATVPFPAASWHIAYDDVANQLRELILRITAGTVQRTEPVAAEIRTTIAIVGLLGLLAVVITLVASIRTGRNLLRRLAGLRQAALELAVDRLPRVIARLRGGEDVDVAGEAPALPYGRDEIGQVGRAFNEVQRSAIHSAVEEAKLRQGINEVFLNIARRSQTLLHRQLTILDRMQRRTDDPIELEDLFRVDHLATRMRRHAEDLVILAGSAPGRGWRNPVPLIDVARGAASEVEDYERVTVAQVPSLALAGRAVGDVIHLLAELIENATAFSPPHTRVNLAGDVVAHGFAFEVEDRGLGMSATDLDAANERLVNPPDFDPGNSAQLGLFVVARLAARHGIKVSLRTSPYGGITAVALIPAELIIGDIEPATGRHHTRRSRAAIAALPAGRPNTGNGAGVPGAMRELPAALTAPGPLSSPTEASRPDPTPANTITAPPSLDVTEQRGGPRHARREMVEPAADESAVPEPTVDDDEPELSADGLPRRVRQSSLAPQLRDPAQPVDATIPSQRSPEQIRTMMSSFQAGMARGREASEATELETPEKTMTDETSTPSTERGQS